MDERPHPHLDQTRAIWQNLQRYRQLGTLVIDGNSLDIAGVVAVSRFVLNKTQPTTYLVNVSNSTNISDDMITNRHGCKPTISKSPEVIKAVNDSVETLTKYLADGSFLYG